MIVEPYDFRFPLSIGSLEAGAMRESNYASNAEDAREGGQSALFSTEAGTRGARSRIEGFRSQLFHVRDLTITSRS